MITWYFLDNHKKVQTFPGGGFASPDPPFQSAAVAASASQVRTLEPSRPLSRPPWVRSTWAMAWNVDHRTARSSTTRPADSETFFWAPFRNLFLVVFRHISGKCGEQLLEKSCRMEPRKKVLESAGLVGGSGPCFGPDMIFKWGQNHQQVGPESRIRPENGCT